MSRVIDEHRQYLEDDHRLAAFEAAIAATIRPGDCVVDLGSGTGVLGLLACRAGARIVYAIEATAIAGLAARIRDANGFHDRIVFVRGFSTQVSLPERADVLVTDQIGRFGFEGEILRCVADARRRMLREGARIVPSAITLHVAPVECARLHDRIAFWDSRPADLDMSPVRRLAANTIYPARFARGDLLGAPADGLRLDLAAARSEPLAFEAALRVERAGVLHGLAGWFSAELASGVDGACLSNSPLDVRRIRRRQVFLPIERAVAVSPGDVVSAAIRILPDDLMVAWTVRVGRAGGRDVFRQSTLEGMLVTREDLDRTHPEFRPSLTPRGVARRSVLELCNGARTLSDIEDEVFRRHSDLFSTRDEAAGFVAEVVTRYGTAS